MDCIDAGSTMLVGVGTPSDLLTGEDSQLRAYTGFAGECEKAKKSTWPGMEVVFRGGS